MGRNLVAVSRSADNVDRRASTRKIAIISHMHEAPPASLTLTQIRVQGLLLAPRVRRHAA